MSIAMLQDLGNQIIIMLNDGTKSIAYPTMGGAWLSDIGKLRELGNQILVTLNDGSKVIAYSTMGGLWIVKNSGIDITGWVRPIDIEFPIVSGFGPREDPGGGGSTNHLGVDFSGAGVTNEPILAAAHGTVTFVGLDDGSGTGFGNNVIITHDAGETTRYGHMIANPPVTVGQVVNAGDIIGNVGSTGASTGAHLHFETRVTAAEPQVDPVPFMAARGVTL